jgi:hypothetical protein
MVCAALLSNVLLPTIFSVAIGLLDPNRGTVGSSLCSAAPGRELPGKAQPGLLVHHCALCTVPAALPPRRPPGIAYEVQIVDEGYPRLLSLSPPTPFRHGPLQARAPPLAS